MTDFIPQLKMIHDTPHKFVLAFTGAGSQALAWLHSVGGSSRTILEATDHYAATSLIDRLGYEPSQFTSPGVARALATQAFFRATELADIESPVLGVGCTATIATDRHKRGDHRAYVALCESQGLTTYGLVMEKGRRNRVEEEELVSRLILWAMMKGCGLISPSQPDFKDEMGLISVTETFEERFESLTLLERLHNGHVDWLVISPTGEARTAPRWPHIALLPGSFNPLHKGHQQLAEIATQELGQPVHFELALINADKAAIDLVEARQRISQFVNVGSVILSRAPLFSQKTHLFPHSTFVIGIDTAKRLLELRFYDNDPAKMTTALEAIQTAGCRFLVAGRLQNDQFRTLASLTIPPQFQDLFRQIPASRFRMDISSTELRAQEN